MNCNDFVPASLPDVQASNPFDTPKMSLNANAPVFKFDSTEFTGRSYQPNIAQAQPFLPVQMRSANFGSNQTPSFDQIVTGQIPSLIPQHLGDQKCQGNTATNLPSAQTNMKKQRKLCNNWLETGFCRFGQNCAYEHPTSDIKDINAFQQQEDEDANRATKCRPFYYNKYC